MEDLRIAYIGGGSRGWAWGFMADLAGDGQMRGVVRLYDIERDAAEKNAVIGNALGDAPGALSAWRYEVASTLKEALDGADFVVISILPGTFAQMRSDVHAPEGYGVYQSVGDSVGLGGFMRALRAVPMFAVIARAIAQYAPKAWVINYTNPMSACVRALYREFPDARAFGCCHEVFGTQKLLAAMLEDMGLARDVPRERIRAGVTGVNHFTWLYAASYDTLDLFPLYRAFADRYFDTGFPARREASRARDCFACTHRVKFDLFRRYGLIAAAGDRHLAEFVPSPYLKDPETARSWGFSLTPVSWRESDLAARLSRRARLLSGEEMPPIAPSGEEGHLLLKALLGLGDRVSNINLPNRGQAPGLPPDAVVETNALFSRGRVEPVVAPRLPHGLNALVAAHCQNHMNTVEAALTCDRPLALATFLADPQAAALTPAQGESLFDVMLANQRAYLDDAWFR